MKDYRDNLTLAEVGANDLEMAKDAIKNAVKVSFYSRKEALAFQAAATRATIDRTGITIRPGMSAKEADAQQKWHNVQIEGRRGYRGDDMWRNGNYVFQKGELVAFISNVFYSKNNRTAAGVIIGDTKPFFVITNAKMR